MRPLRYVLALVLFSACDDHEFKSEGETVDGEGLSAVLDVMEGNCASCHSGDAPAFALDLTSELFCDSVLDGRLVVPNDAAGSVLQQRIEGDPSIMPPTTAMDEVNIAIVRDWINDGADCGDGDGDGDDDSDDGSDGSSDDGGGALDGAQIYADSCSGCHGGSGEGAYGPSMDSVVPSLSEAEVADIALNGTDSGSMLGQLTDADEADAVAAFCTETWGS